MGLPCPRPLGYRAAQVAHRLQHLEEHPVIGPEEPEFGETFFAELVTCDPQRNDAEYWLGCLAYGHLPAHLQDASRPFSELARQIFDPLFEAGLTVPLAAHPFDGVHAASQAGGATEQAWDNLG